MNKHSEHVDHARALRADIMASPNVWLPRRDKLIEWLDGFLTRSESPKYELEETEAADLTALDRFLRVQQVPAAA